VGAAYITSDPAGAKVVVDGTERGATPLTVRDLSAGEHIVELILKDYEKWVGKVEIKANRVELVEARLSKETGSLMVISTPPRAEIYVDGKLVGTTPITVEKVEIGEREVRIKRGGFREFVRRVVVIANLTTAVEAALEAVGTLTVRANVSGASVYIDGVNQGAADMSLELSPGTYRVKVTKSGYQDYETTISIAAGDSRVVSVVLGPPGTEYVKDGRYYRRGQDGKEIVWIPGGTFTMGSNDGASDEKPPHQVTVSGFWMDVTEVTNAEFRKFRSNWSYDSGKANHPVVSVTWNDARDYCGWAGKRLPTEAEWEYAAGGPEHYKWSLGNTFEESKYTWDSNRGNPTREVGSHPANGFGLYDMSGNVWEWVSSLYKPYPYRVDDGREDLGASGSRVLRGGSWADSAGGLRVAGRYVPSFRNALNGFRCARS
jgi:iron(II)-dependent oxidoreductase